MPDKDQVMMFNSAELSLCKNTFADNDVLMYTIRKVFLQMPMTDVEKGLIKQAMTPEVIALLKKRILPSISPELPLGQLPSILNNLSDNLKTMTVAEIAPHFKSKAKQIAYLQQQFDVLSGASTDEPIRLADFEKLDGKTDEERFVDITTYLFLLGWIDPNLILYRNMAGMKDESEADQKKRLTRNSSK